MPMPRGARKAGFGGKGSFGGKIATPKAPRVRAASAPKTASPVLKAMGVPKNADLFPGGKKAASAYRKGGSVKSKSC